MLKSNPTVLVVGAAGRFAGLVVPEFVRRGVTVRALVRSEANAATARARGATEIASGDLRDVPSLEAAAEGVDAVFHIGPAFVADEAELGLNMVGAAKRTGVRKFVFSSVIHPTNISLKNHASKLPVEDAIFKSGMQYTILHPAGFYQTLAGAWPSIVERGVFGEPFPTKSKVARVDYRDVAEVAAMAVTDDEFANGTFELCATVVDREGIVAIISEVLGRRIEAVELDFKAWSAKLPYDAQQKQMFEKVFDAYRNYGTAGNSLVLRSILNREPRSLREYIRELAAQSRVAAE